MSQEKMTTPPPVPFSSTPPPIPPRSNKALGGTPTKGGINSLVVSVSPDKSMQVDMSPSYKVMSRPPILQKTGECVSDEPVLKFHSSLNRSASLHKSPLIANQPACMDTDNNKTQGFSPIVNKKQSMQSPLSNPCALFPKTPPTEIETSPLGITKISPAICRNNIGGSDSGTPRNKTENINSLDSPSGWAKVSAKFINKKEMNIGMQRWRSVLSAHMGGQ